jgi:hypothetical protein
MEKQTYLMFEDQKTLAGGNHRVCCDFIARLMLKLEWKKIKYSYDDLNYALRVELDYSTKTRIVEYIIA